ncbi:hypothetical protein B1756_15805 [Natrarchaeobaculum aegyptiacum]|uniref:Uncharacterized protein n=1 Tax=Natrarchaeobaculum aegyptiacum TaxID=745377 RepID=A0A2Z2HV28_9EURY|nr:hypothetical protein B1756_15805 [Natrarchaeobaculum aegyptiacum]
MRNMDFYSITPTSGDGITLLGLEHNITAMYLTTIQREYLYTLCRYRGRLERGLETPLIRGRATTDPQLGERRVDAIDWLGILLSR